MEESHRGPMGAHFSENRLFNTLTRHCLSVETDVFESGDLGRARRVASQPVTIITIDLGYAAGEATKKRPVFGRLPYLQGSAMAATGEWRDKVGCSNLISVSLERAVC